jgi:hypothetical protein
MPGVSTAPDHPVRAFARVSAWMGEGEVDRGDSIS